MAQVAAGFTSWLGTLDWGTVPTWVGSILTSISVFLALYILRQNQKDKKRELVNKVFARLEYRGRWGKVDRDMYSVHVYNASDQPVPSVFLIIADKYEVHHEMYFADDDKKNAILMPEASGEIEFATDDEMSDGNMNANKGVIFLQIIDADNGEWYRDLATRRYVSRRHVKRQMKGAEKRKKALHKWAVKNEAVMATRRGKARWDRRMTRLDKREEWLYRWVRFKKWFRKRTGRDKYDLPH